FYFFFQAEDGIRVFHVTGVQTCALPIFIKLPAGASDDVAKTALAKAEGIVTRARAEPSSFADLARKESQDAGTARDGGRLGWIQRGTLPLPMEQAVSASNQAGISNPGKAPAGTQASMPAQARPEQAKSSNQ